MRSTSKTPVPQRPIYSVLLRETDFLLAFVYLIGYNFFINGEEEYLAMEDDKIENDEVELAIEDLEDASFFLGNEYYQEHDYEKAIEKYDDVLKNVEDYTVRIKSFYWMGESYVKLHRMDEAIETFSQLIDEFKDHHLVASAQRRIAHLEEIYGGDDE